MERFQSIVKPQCGRLVGFSAGRENLHGVQGVQKGRRCAVGLWFTFNPIYEEIERILAKQVLYQVQESGNVADQLIQELKKYVKVQEPVSSIFLDKKTTRTTNKQQHKVRNKYIKKSLKFKEKHFYVLQHKKPIKLLIERHKEANILNFNAP
ncbi:hypothetical protein C0J52_09525 [Blattella germanica]|nr:hypothetical protein C0J52_09525 [Blattella germanica]